MFELNTLENMAIPFPEREIFLRLGGNVAKTVLPEDSAAAYRKTALEAFGMCVPCGRWKILKCEVKSDGVLLDGNVFIPGADFARRCSNAAFIWCGAVTVGNAVLTKRDQLARVSQGAVYDAVAGECADAAMDALTRLARNELRRRGLGLSERRFSPGYGDMPLELQKFFYDKLNMAQMGIRLTENCFLFPEKSVTAFAFIYNLQENQS